MVLMGINPADPVFRDATVSADFARLISPESLLIDQKTHREYGPRNGRRWPSDMSNRLDPKASQIAGLFEMGSVDSERCRLTEKDLIDRSH
jgi:hypothetical protein